MMENMKKNSQEWGSSYCLNGKFKVTLGMEKALLNQRSRIKVV